MSIKFKTLERGEPGVVGGGTKKWYAATVNDQHENLKGLTLDIERMSTVNRADILAVLSSLVQLIPERLVNSTIVELGDLGNFRTSIKSTGALKEEDVSSNNIIGYKVVFYPGKDIKNALKTATYEKVQ